MLERAGLALDVPLGDVQYSDRGGRRVPIHGGHGAWEGVTNFVHLRPQTTTLEPDPPRAQRVEGSRFLTAKGYPITGGTSFVMVLEFTDRGPRALALLVSGQTGDTTSPRFREQTEMFAARLWWTFPTVPPPAGGSAGSSSHASSGASPARLRSLHLESTPEMAALVAVVGYERDLPLIGVDTRALEVHRTFVTSS